MFISDWVREQQINSGKSKEELMIISSEDKSYLIERIPGVKDLLDTGDVGGY